MLVGPITTLGASRCRVGSEIRNTDDGRVCPILQWPCSASGGKVSCWSARSQSHQKNPQCCRTYESFRVFSVTSIKSSFTTASERIPCLGFIKRITCQNRARLGKEFSPPFTVTRVVSSVAEMKWLWHGSGRGELVTEELGVPALKLQAEGGHTPLGEQWGTASSWQPSVGFTALRVRRRSG